jgi:outer membrane protein assembly factor BamB
MYYFMKTPLLITFCLLSILACKPSPPPTETTQTTPADTSVTEVVNVPGLNRLWDTDKTLTTSESVLYDKANDLLYVSCINGTPPDKKDNDGFIARVGMDGKIKDLKWATGFSGPKGMGLSGNTLYVTDINQLVSVDVATGKIIKKWKVDGASFLNDVAIAEDGKVYFTDSNTSTVYALADDKVNVVLQDSTLGGCNGILIEGNNAYLAGYMNGKVSRLDLTTKQVQVVSPDIPSGDGIELFGDALLVSNWNGQVYHIANSGDVTLLLDSQDAKLNSADIEVIPEKNLLLVPTFFGNTVTAYELVKN